MHGDAQGLISCRRLCFRKSLRTVTPPRHEQNATERKLEKIFPEGKVFVVTLSLKGSILSEPQHVPVFHSLSQVLLHRVQAKSGRESFWASYDSQAQLVLWL